MNILHFLYLPLVLLLIKRKILYLLSNHHFLALYCCCRFLHRPVPVALQWVDIHWFGVAFVDEGCGVAVGKFCLYQAILDLFFSGSLYEALQLGSTRLPAFFLYGKLLQLVIAGEVGEDRVIDHKLANQVWVLVEGLLDDAVSLVDDAEQRLVVLLEERLVLRLQFAERLENVAGYDAGVAATHPYMRVDVATRSLGRFDAHGSIYHLHIRSIVLQLLHPSLLKTDAAHFQIEGTLRKFHHLLGVWLVSFRVVAIRYHHVDIHLAFGNLINEILVGGNRNCNCNRRLLCSGSLSRISLFLRCTLTSGKNDT